jgi:hypothetical protein
MERRKLDKLYKDNFSLDSISCVYSQEPDCEEGEMGPIQVLKLETISNGVSSFIRLSLPDGGHWSIDSKEDLDTLFEDFNSRFEFNDEIN